MRLQRISPLLYLEIEDKPTTVKVVEVENEPLSGITDISAFFDGEPKNRLKWNRSLNRITFKLKNLRKAVSHH